MVNWQPAVVLAITFVVVLTMGSGCSTSGGKVAGERVDIRMLTPQQLRSYHNGPQNTARQGADAQQTAVKEQTDAYRVFFRRLNDSGGKAFQRNLSKVTGWDAAQEFFPPLPLVGSVLSGFVIDYVRTQLQRSADRHEAQYGAVRYFDDYWNTDHEQAQYQAQYVAVAVERWLRPSPDANEELASAIIVLLLAYRTDEIDNAKVSPFGLMIPFFYGNVAPKTRVASRPGTMAVDLELVIDVAWLDQHGRFHVARTADLRTEWTNYDVRNGDRVAIYRTCKALDAGGWFQGVPRWRDSKNNEIGGGTFRVAVRVTERDESRYRQIIERGVKYISDNRGSFTGAVKTQLGGN